jgi:UDP-glucose 4-epimerase
MPAISSGKFVITGGASQVGSHIAEHLLRADAGEIVLLDNLSLGSADLLQPLLADGRCKLVRGDVLRLNELVDAFDGADGVFAVAALMATSIRQDPWMGLDVNIRGLQNTFEASRIRGVKKVVLSSSAGIYGASVDVPTDEDSPLRWQSLPPALSLYCTSKAVGESLARFYLENHGISFVALRYTSVYGERQHRRALMGGHIGDTCERIRNGLPPILEGDGRQVSDYIYAGDVARANLMAMESAITGESMNICSGIEIPQKRIVEIAAKACGSKVEAEVRGNATTAKLAFTTRQAYSRDKAKRLLGWEPEVSIEEGVGRVLRWVDEQRALTA